MTRPVLLKDIHLACLPTGTLFPIYTPETAMKHTAHLHLLGLAV